MEFNKYEECIHCEKFYECAIKIEKPDYCLHFKEREEDKNG